jgi:anti-anti-sigma factor
VLVAMTLGATVDGEVFRDVLAIQRAGRMMRLSRRRTAPNAAFGRRRFHCKPRAERVQERNQSSTVGCTCPRGRHDQEGSAIAEPTFADPEDRAPTVVAVRGELDFATVPALLAGLEGIEGDVDLDCSRLTYLDSNGLDALIGAHRGCEARGSRLTIRGLSGSCLRIVRLAHADPLLNLRWP